MDQRSGVTRGTKGSAWALILTSAALLPVGCSRPRSGASEPASTSAQASPSLPAALAKPPEARARAGELEAAVHLPALAAGQKAPLLVMLHGLGASAEQIEAASDWLNFANQRGIAWLAPNGPFDEQGRRFWDAGSSCCNFGGPPIDHVAALTALIESALAEPGVDRGRVFVGGHSNGAFMAHRLACERPALVRGVVAIAGTGPLEATSCNPPSDLRVLQIHGEADPIVPYAGGHLFSNSSYPQHLSAAKSTRNWASLMGCGETPVSLPAVDLEPSLPGAETSVQSYPNCKAGKLELWTVKGGSHNVGFRSPAPAAVWRFLTE